MAKADRHNDTRELVRIRDNHTCQGCRKKWVAGTRRLDVHHLGGLCGKRLARDDKVDDLPVMVTLCHKCHYNHPEHSKRLDGTYKLDRQRRVLALAKEGYTHTHIAEKLGISRQRVSQITIQSGHRIRLRTVKFIRTPAAIRVTITKDKVAALLREGHTQASIARHFGVRPGYVYHATRKYRLRTGTIWDIIKNGPVT